MHSVTSISLCFFFFFTILIHIVVGADVPLQHFCSDSGNFTSSSSYEKNLQTLFNQLSVKVPPSGFGLGSVGNQDTDTVHGLALCRGNLLNAACKSCVNTAIQDIQLQCPNQKGAVIFYDSCMLKYLDSNFFGEIDSVNKFYAVNRKNVSDAESFNGKTKKLLSQLSNEAFKSPKLFAISKVSFGESETLHGLVQCTRDLSDAQCKKCLDDAVTELPICCDGKRRGWVVEGSCNVRYDMFPSSIKV